MPKQTRPVRELVERLPVKLSQEELLERGNQLAAIEEDLVAHSDHAEDVKKQLKQREAELGSRRSVLAITVRRREELRDVNVIVYAHPTREGWVQDVRGDTGEVIRERRAESDELQEDMFETTPRVTKPACNHMRRGSCELCTDHESSDD